MQNPDETYPDGSDITLQRLKASPRSVKSNGSRVRICGSRMQLTLEGTGNRVLIEHSAGKLIVQGHLNHVTINHSWITCELQGSGNILSLAHAEFLLARNQGIGNYVPGVTPRHRMHALSARLTEQRFLQIRTQAEQTNRKRVEQLVDKLATSKYQSQRRQCPICCDDMLAGQDVTALFCFHLFHSPCIAASLHLIPRCPLCSLDLLTHLNRQLADGNYLYQADQLLIRDSIEDHK